MENKEIIIGGIDRHTSAQDAQLGVCEELINVRNDLTGLHLYKQGEGLSAELPYTNIYLHRWNGKVFYIGINPQNNVVSFDLDGDKVQDIQSISSADQVDIKSIGNMLIVSDKGGEDGEPSTITYVLETINGVTQYKQLNHKDLPLPTIAREDIYLKPIRYLSNYWASISKMGTYSEATTPGGDTDQERHIFPFFHHIPDGMRYDDEFKQGVKESLQGALGRVMAMDKHLAHGYVLIGTTVTLYDGTETGFSNLQVVDLSCHTPYRDEGAPAKFKLTSTDGDFMTIIPEKNSLDGLFFEFNRYDYGQHKLYMGVQVDGGDLYDTEKTSTYFHTITPTLTLPENIDIYKDYIKSINLYVSKPIDKIDWESFDVMIYNTSTNQNIETSLGSYEDVHSLFADSGNKWRLILYPKAPIRHLEDMKDELHKQLLFQQKSWSVQEVIDNGYKVSYECEFGSSEGTLGKTLEVSAWNTTRAGKMFVYNNRIHMYDSKAMVTVLDSDLQGLNGYENVWYSKVAQPTQSGAGEYYFAIASSMETRDKMYVTDVKNMLDVARTKGCYLGVYRDISGSGAPTDYNAYEWYQVAKSKNFYPNNSSPRCLCLRAIQSLPIRDYYMFFSFDKNSYVHYGADGVVSASSFALKASQAGFIAIHDNDSIGNNPWQLPWYEVGSDSAHSWADEHKTRLCTVIAYLKQEGNTLVIRHENIPILFKWDVVNGAIVLSDTALLSGLLTYPDSRCERLVIQYSRDGQVYSYEVSMSSDGSAYNYAYAYVSEEIEFVLGQLNEDQTKNMFFETDILNVTQLNNPTVFNVSNSYRFKGDITGLSLALEELNTMQTGSYPLYVLTTQGVFALQQGSGGVLYSNISPVTVDNCEKGKYIQVRNGVAYIANNRLYWLYGRQKVDILMPLDGNPDLEPRNNTSYPAACCTQRLYDISPYLCNVPILTYIQGVKLTYDSYHNELILSNSDYSYSFVFNFDAKKWFKITGEFSSIGDIHIIGRNLGTISGIYPRGSITIGLLATEESADVSDHNYCAIQSNVRDNTTFATKGERVSLVHAGVVLASMTLQADATLPATLSLLTRNLSWIETDINTYQNYQLTTKIYIKSQRTLSTSESVYLVNNSTSERVAFTLYARSTSHQTTAPKLIGSTITLALTHPTDNTKTLTIASKSIDENETISSLCDWIVQQINNSSLLLDATRNTNTVNITGTSFTKELNGLIPTLSIANSSSGWIKQQAFLSYSYKTLDGGKQEITNNAIRLIQLTNEIEDDYTIFHIQTRPQKLLPMTFATIYRTIVRVRTSLSYEIPSTDPDIEIPSLQPLKGQNLSAYIFASNNLKDYKCVAAEQREICTIDRIRLERIAHAYKYFVFIIGGIVSTKTELSTIITQIKPNANKHIR